MNESPTPETDALMERLLMEGSTWGENDVLKLMRHSHALEQERDAARATCAELVTDGNAITLAESLRKVEAERDELRKVCDALAEAWHGYKTFPSLANERLFFAAMEHYNSLPHVVERSKVI